MIRHLLHHLALPCGLLAIGMLSTIGLMRAFGEGSATHGAQPAAGDDQDKPTTADARPVSGTEGEAIRQVTAAYIEALNKGDVKAIHQAGLGGWKPRRRVD